MKLTKLLGEYYRYNKVRLVAVILGIAWITFFVDMLGFSGLVSSLLYTLIIGNLIFAIHKWKGAKF